MKTAVEIVNDLLKLMKGAEIPKNTKELALLDALAVDEEIEELKMSIEEYAEGTVYKIMFNGMEMQEND